MGTDQSLCRVNSYKAKDISRPAHCCGEASSFRLTLRLQQAMETCAPSKPAAEAAEPTTNGAEKPAAAAAEGAGAPEAGAAEGGGSVQDAPEQPAATAAVAGTIAAGGTTEAAAPQAGAGPATDAAAAVTAGAEPMKVVADEGAPDKPAAAAGLPEA